jgi:hypothetical protein
MFGTDCLVCPIDGGFDIAKYGIHPFERTVLYYLIVTCHYWLMPKTASADNSKTWKSIGYYMTLPFQYIRKNLGQGRTPKAGYPLQLHSLRFPVICGLNGGNKRSLSARTAPAFAAPAPAPNIGVIHFHSPA